MYSTLYCCQILMKHWENIQIYNFTKICPEGAELFHPDERTDRHEAYDRLLQFYECTQ